MITDNLSILSTYSIVSAGNRFTRISHAHINLALSSLTPGEMESVRALTIPAPPRRRS